MLSSSKVFLQNSYAYISSDRGTFEKYVASYVGNLEMFYIQTQQFSGLPAQKSTCVILEWIMILKVCACLLLYWKDLSFGRCLMGKEAMNIKNRSFHLIKHMKFSRHKYILHQRDLGNFLSEGHIKKLPIFGGL